MDEAGAKELFLRVNDGLYYDVRLRVERNEQIGVGGLELTSVGILGDFKVGGERMFIFSIISR